MTLDGDGQFAIASEEVRDLARRRLSGAMSLRDFDREIGSLNTTELGQLTALLEAPLHARKEEDSDGPLFEAT